MWNYDCVFYAWARTKTSNVVQQKIFIEFKGLDFICFYGRGGVEEITCTSFMHANHKSRLPSARCYPFMPSSKSCFPSSATPENECKQIASDTKSNNCQL